MNDDRQQILTLIDKRIYNTPHGVADALFRLNRDIKAFPDPDDELPGRPGDVDGERWCRGRDVPAVGWEWHYSAEEAGWQDNRTPGPGYIVVCRPIPNPVITITIPRKAAEWIATHGDIETREACAQALKDNPA